MKDEMYSIINEAGRTPSIVKPTLSPEWCASIRSDVELCHLRSNYGELYGRHIENPHEITPDLYAEMIEKFGLLRNSYLNLVKDHAALKDDLERLTRQLIKATDVRVTIVGSFTFG